MISDLDKAFNEAFEKISKLKKAIAPDVMLKFYAFYKQASYGNHFSFSPAGGFFEPTVPTAG